jgi:hypothetical protein
MSVVEGSTIRSEIAAEVARHCNAEPELLERIAMLEKASAKENGKS